MKIRWKKKGNNRNRKPLSASHKAAISRALKGRRKGGRRGMTSTQRAAKDRKWTAGQVAAHDAKVRGLLRKLGQKQRRLKPGHAGRATQLLKVLARRNKGRVAARRRVLRARHNQVKHIKKARRHLRTLARRTSRIGGYY